MHIVFGGSGGLGSAVIRELVRRGEAVRSVTRGGSPAEGAEAIAADAADVEAAKKACEGGAVVYCCAGIPYTGDWPKNWPPLLRGIIEGASSAGARLVMGDNLYMYAPPTGKLTEDLPETASTRKGAVRVEMSRMLREAHDSGRVQTTSARASDYYGPGVTNAALADRVFGAALRGEKAQLLGDVDKLHSYAYIDDVARAMILLGERDEAQGKVWHVPHAPAVTTRRFVEKVYRAAGAEPRIQVAPRFVVNAMGWFIPMMRELKEMLYQWEEDFVVDDSRFRAAFGDQAAATPIDEGVAATLEWYGRRRS